MITLYHAPQSRSSRMIWLLEELGAPYTLAITNIARMDGSGGPDAANPHPDKKVPAITDGSTVVSESSAVCLYLTDAFPDAGIGPTVGDPNRGAYLTWLAYYSGVIEPVVTMGFAGLGDHPVLLSSWRGRSAVDARILGALEVGPYVLGEKFSAVDILLGSMGSWSRQMLPAGPVVDAYLERLNARPARTRAKARDAG